MLRACVQCGTCSGSCPRGRNLAISILYLPQFLGLAAGLSEKQVGLDLNLAVLPAFRDRLARVPAAARAGAAVPD